jgi:hypothetical protein
MINNTGPIPYTVENSLVLHKILDSLEEGFLIPQVRVTWPKLEERFASNLDKLLISLRAYYDSANPVIPKERLFDILCEKDAAKILKNIRIKSMMLAWRSSFVDTPDWWDECPSYVIYDIGDIFYYKYCFFWEEECCDYDYQLQPVITDPDVVKDFIESTEAIMDELDFDFDFEPSEILYQPRSSKVIDSKMESVYDFQTRFEKRVEFRFGPRQPGKRCVIPVHPGGVRDTIINQIPDLNTILAIDKIVSKCLRNFHGTVVPNVDRFTRELNEFYSNYDFFYCRDIEKEGITKPRYLLKIMLKALEKRTPYLKEVCTSDFFDGDWCQIDDNVIHSERGHGLGMGNSLTTLMQIIIYRMTFNRYMADHECKDNSVDFYTLNDDCVFGLNLTEEESFEFSQVDHEILEDLGLIRKKTKSFLVRKGFVFLEIYNPPGFNRKDSIMRRTMLLPYSAVNIVHAKDLMSLMGSNPYIDIILQKWGYEFYPDEIHQPRHFGGWFSKNFYGIDISLDYVIEEFNSKMSRAAQAVLESDRKFKRKLVKTCDPFNLLSYPNIDEYIRHKLPIAGSAFFSSFERLKIRSDFNIIYKNLAEKRQRIFLTRKYVDLKTYLTELKNSSDRDIFMSSFPSRWIKKFDIDRFVDGVFTDPYRYNYPISSGIRKLKGIDIKGYPSSYWPLTHSDSSFTCTVLRSEIAELNLDYHAFEYTDEDVVLPNKEADFQEFISSWRNPVAVGKYCQLKYNRLMIPDKVPEVLKYKKGFFSRDLTRIEFLLLQGEKYSVIQDYLNSNKDLESFLEELEEERKSRVFSTPPVSRDEDDDENDDDSDPDDFDPTNLIERFGSAVNVRPLRQQVILDLPEGWDLSSFELNENIIYVCENRELFTPETLEYLNYQYDHCVDVWDSYFRFMKYADPYSMGVQFLRDQLKILDRCKIIKEYIFDQMIKNESKDKTEDEGSEEAEFQGDFDMF